LFECVNEKDDERLRRQEGKKKEEYLWRNGGTGLKFETKPFVVFSGEGHRAASVQNLISWPYFCSVGVRGED